jgi:hypothetical protein
MSEPMFEEVKLEHLGKGGQRDDLPLTTEAEQHLARLAVLVQDDRATGAGKLTIKIRVEHTGEGAVLISYSMQVTDPPMSRKALPAHVNEEDGGLYAVAHKQAALDLGDNVRPMPGKGKVS